MISISDSSRGVIVLVLLSSLLFLSCLIGDETILFSSDILSGGIELIALLSLPFFIEILGDFGFRLGVYGGCADSVFEICYVYVFCCFNEGLLAVDAGVSISFLSNAEAGAIF